MILYVCNWIYFILSTIFKLLKWPCDIMAMHMYIYRFFFFLMMDLSTSLLCTNYSQGKYKFTKHGNYDCERLCSSSVLL